MVGILIFSGSSMSSVKIVQLKLGKLAMVGPSFHMPHVSPPWMPIHYLPEIWEKDGASDGTRPRYKRNKVVFGAEE